MAPAIEGVGRRLVKMALGEGFSRTGFQIFLEGECGWFVWEREIVYEFPWSSGRSGFVLAGVVAGQTGFKIMGETGVSTPRIGRALQKIDVVHPGSDSRCVS